VADELTLELAGGLMRARALELARGALRAIEASRARVDDLNVYPVPDGDTGTNLTLTVRAVVEALETEGPDDRPGLAREIARAALMGARGNSGVILSQIARGAAEALAVSDDPARVLRAASDAAYRGVKRPVEGTMLTAIRELAEAAEAGADLPGIVRAGEECVVRTEAMLPVLRDAGVVDAGAAGLVEIVRGVVATLTGEELPAAPSVVPGPGIDAIHLEESRFRYCTVLVVEGSGLDADELEAVLEPLGDSLLVVGDSAALKIHVHVDDPGVVLSAAVARGTIDGVEIADMRAQALEREQRLARAASAAPVAAAAAVAIAAGEGNCRLFESLGARVVDGGRTMNPSTSDILAAIEAAPAPAAIVLPNNRNVFMAAEHAAQLASKRVLIVPTESLQAGIAAAGAYIPSNDVDTNLAAMREAADAISVGAIAVASRDTLLDGAAVAEGAWLGLVNGTLVASAPDFGEVAREVVDRLLAEPRDLLTLLTGPESPPLDSLLDAVRGAHPAVEVELHDGGQPHYALLLSAE